MTDASGPKDISTLTPADWYKRFVYVVSDDCFFDVETQQEYSRQSFNAIFRGVPCFSIHNKQRRIEAATSFDENRAALGSRVLAGITFAPGESSLVAKSDGTVWANRWRNARPQGKSGNPMPWLLHAERMLPNELERNHVLDVLAHKVQHPNKKINHAVLHCGLPGSGKDTFYAPFLWAVGGYSLHNVVSARADDVTGTWGYALESEVVVLNELRQAHTFDRRALENQLKPLIAAPPEFLMVNRKGLHPYPALNRILVLAFSNERMPIALSAEDRRWFVVWSTAPRMTSDEGMAIWDWYLNGGGYEAVAGYLRERDVSKFNCGATPPMTDAKRSLLDLSLSPAESYLSSMISRREGPFARGVVGSPFSDVLAACGGLTAKSSKELRETLLATLQANGWVDMGRCTSRHYTTPRNVWCAPEHAKKTPTEVRNLLEDGPPLSVVG
jgi:hypothetical protein